MNLRKRPRLQPFLGVLGIVLAVAFVHPARSRAQDRDWTRNPEMVLIHEAWIKVNQTALEPPPATRTAQEAIRSLVSGLDPYSGYLTPKEFQAFRRASDENYAGVGMDLAQDRQGRLFCLPFPDSPAEKAGIGYGQELLEVDDRPVKERSVYLVGAAIRGPAGTAVGLTLSGPGGEPVRIRVTRRPVKFRSVLTRTEGGLPVFRIIRFTPRTRTELKEALARLRPGSPLIIDLRGNIGGDLEAAIGSADLFLGQGKKIVGLITRDGEKIHRSGKGPALFKGHLFLWQDHRTASAAEVFLAALSRNGRGVSLGRTSFGKGLAQKIVELTDGSALMVTFASLRPPGGRPFEGRGLDPDHQLNYPIPDREVADRILLNLVRGILRGK